MSVNREQNQPGRCEADDLAYVVRLLALQFWRRERAPASFAPSLVAKHPKVQKT